MIYYFIAFVGLSAVMMVGLVLWLSTFLDLGKFLSLVTSLGAIILAVAFFNLLVVAVANQDSSGSLGMLFTNPAYTWNIVRAVFIPALFGCLIVGVTLYAGTRYYRRREKRIAGIALLAASGVGLFLLFIVSGALLIVIHGG